MRKIVMFLIVIFSFVIFSNDVSAEVCDDADMQRLKQLANMIEVNYEYIDGKPIGDSEDDSYSVNSYYLFINNLTEQLYIKDGIDEYYHSDLENGTLKLIHNSGQIQLLVYSTRCRDIVLRTIDLKLPKFNVYSFRNECIELKDLNLDFCDEWYQGYLDDRIFATYVEPYLVNRNIEISFKDKVLNLLENYYIYMIIGVVSIILLILLIVRYKKRSVLE